MDKQAVSGLILAGGAGRRMGGMDKGLLAYRGRPLIAHAIERLSPQVSGLLISANRHLDDYRGFGHPVVADTLSGFAGPLAGLAAGLAACPTDWLATCPCDCPALPDDLVERLWSAAQEQPWLAVAATPEGLQPAFLLCHRTLLPDLAAFLAEGQRKAAAWCSQQRAIAVPFPDALPFRNLNTPADLV